MNAHKTRIAGIISATLAALFILSLLLASCAPGSQPGDTPGTSSDSGTPSGTTGGAQPEGGFHEIRIGDETTAYRLVRPDRDVKERTQILVDLNNYLKTFCGFGITPATDWYKSGTEVPRFEILLGNTDRDETRAAMSRISPDGYSVSVYGEKIVIAAHRRETLLQAVEYFKSCLYVSEENGTVVLWFRGDDMICYGESTSEYLFSGKNGLADYRIVCNLSDSQIYSSASELARGIRTSFGAELEIANASTAESAREIIVGDCGRKEAASALSDIEDTDFTVRVIGQKLFIGGKSPEVTSVAVSRFMSEYVTGLYSNRIILPSTLSMTAKAYNYQDGNGLSFGADIRVMSFNILTELWDAKIPVAGRDIIVNDIIGYYSPDVIGLQEVSDGWHASFAKLFEGKYKICDTRNGQGKTNFSPVAYNVEKTKMLNHGVTVFSQGNDTRLRLASWGYFEQISSGKRYIVVSTHWDLGKNAEYQIIHANEMADLVLELGRRFGCPVITTGDYNSNEESTPYRIYVSKTGYSDAKHSADVVNRYSNGTHTVGSSPSIGETLLCIDHIFGSEGVKFLYFNVLVDSFVNRASDHNPIYADIKLPE